MTGPGEPASERPAGQGQPPAGEGKPTAGEPQPAPGGRLARLNTGGLIYGTIVSTAALAVGAVRFDTARDIVETTTYTLLVYWLAHVYVATIGGRGQRNTRPLPDRIRSAARHEAMILAGGAPTVVISSVLALAGVGAYEIVLISAAGDIVVLALDGLLAGLQAGARGWALMWEILSAAVFGVLLAGLLQSLHG